MNTIPQERFQNWKDMQQYKTSSLIRRQKRWAIYRHGEHYWIKYNSKESNAKYKVKLKQ